MSTKNRRLALFCVLAVIISACASGGSAPASIPLERTRGAEGTDRPADRTDDDASRDASRDAGRDATDRQPRSDGSQQRGDAITSAPKRGTDGVPDVVPDVGGETASSEESRRDEDDASFREENQVPGDVEFRDYGENRFVETDADNLSTFAIDVDTGSYTLMRSWVEQGLIPPPESVRSEEYVNFFESGHESPSDATFAVFADGGPTPFTDQRDDVVLRLSIEGREVPARSRPAVSLTFVVDVSGSMERDDRLELVKESLAVLLDDLNDADTIAIVAYEDRAWVALEPTSAGERDIVAEAIHDLRPGGSTNAEAGVVLGYEVAGEMFDRGGVNKVLLLSDGVANVGEAGPDGIIDQISGGVDDGIGLVTVGVGLGNYNDVLMEQLADGADGSYHYADTIDEAERIFDERLTATLVTIAKNVKVQVAFDPDTVEWYRLVGFENRDVADEDFRDDRVDGGEIGAGHSVTALYQIELTSGASTRDDLGEVTVRWEDAETGRVDEVVGRVGVERLSETWSDTDPHFRLVATAAAFAEELGDGRHTGAYDMLDVAEEAGALASQLRDSQSEELEYLVNRILRLDDRR